MPDAADKTELIGFLTVIEHQKFGLIGGFLVLNPAGRPVEFHCTSPVKANRAQEILYGNSLYPFLYGEQIGQTLVSKSRSSIDYLFTDSVPVLAVQDFIETPTVYVCCPDEVSGFGEGVEQSLRSFGIEPEKSETISLRPNPGSKGLCDIPGLSVARWQPLRLGNCFLSVPAESSESLEMHRRRLACLMKTLDFVEPFERIRLAVDEAQKAA